MITVTILVDGNPLYTRSVVDKVNETGFYLGDDGSRIKHAKEDGNVALAIKMLKTIKEVKENEK